MPHTLVRHSGPPRPRPVPPPHAHADSQTSYFLCCPISFVSPFGPSKQIPLRREEEGRVDRRMPGIGGSCTCSCVSRTTSPICGTVSFRTRTGSAEGWYLLEGVLWHGLCCDSHAGSSAVQIANQCQVLPAELHTASSLPPAQVQWAPPQHWVFLSPQIGEPSPQFAYVLLDQQITLRFLPCTPLEQQFWHPRPSSPVPRFSHPRL